MLLTERILKTYHIHFNGIVQGVGFRPTVYQLATEMHLNGYVKNGNNGISIYFNASDEAAKLFFEKLSAAIPLKAKVIFFELKKVAPEQFDGFTVLLRDDDTERKVLLSPDISICESCRTEMNDPDNRRYRYPFITCTQCGPRYSIIKDIPYERHNTTMHRFVMCSTCNNEYLNITAKRFLSQTNSCADCGIKLQLFTKTFSILSEDTEKVLFHIKNFLLQGKILAVKGIGGYSLLCDAGNQQTLKSLRSRKWRPSKPFAVLYPDIATVQSAFAINEQEQSLLESPEAPIVLLYPKRKAADAIAIDDIAPGLRRVGVMLPNSPLLELISHDIGRPLIATSANVSGSPIIYKDVDALENLFDIADFVISFNREIVVPQDDSVVQVSKHSGQQIILRRSRGYAPTFIDYKPAKDLCVLSTGAFLKSTFTLAVNGNVFVSQFLGSSESFESQRMYKHTLEHWLSMYKVHPDIIIADNHPEYFAHQYAIQLAERHSIKVKYVQHHEAHFSAVLAENELLQAKQAILGVIWDGTGLGTDGNIWGGEFFSYQDKAMVRYSHFEYIPNIAGDKMALEPRLSAFCAAYKVWPSDDYLKNKFTEIEWLNYGALIKDPGLLSSSVGRIFDAVASLLDLCDKQSYEGEAAMYLAALAEEYTKQNGFSMHAPYFNSDASEANVSTTTLIEGVIMDMHKGEPIDYIAARFHYSLVCIIDAVAKRLQTDQICFSGGVFQNMLLVDWINHVLANKYQLYFHKNLSPNDENISFGQMVYCENDIVTTGKNEIIHDILADRSL